MIKRKVVGRIYGMKYTWKGHKDGDRHKNRLKTSGQARLVYVKNINRDIPTTWRWARGDPKGQKESKIHHHASREGSGNSRDSLSVGHIQLELRYHLLRGMAEEVTASTLHSLADYRDGDKHNLMTLVTKDYTFSGRIKKEKYIWVWATDREVFTW